MIYHPDDFITLVSSIENEGGYVEPNACEGTSLVYKLDGKNRRVQTTHCDLHARVGIPYDPTEPIDFETYTDLVNAKGDTERRRDRIRHGGEIAKGASFAAVCAVDDAVGLWPRFAHLMSEESYQR